MRTAASLCCLLAASHALARDVPTYDARTFYETVTYFGASFSADETKVLVTSDATGVFNVYAWPVGGGEPEQLTHSTTDANMGVGWFPNDDRFLYTADQGGNELNHLYVKAPNGRTTDLTPGDGLKAQFGGWADDDGGFYVMTNERDPRRFDVYRYEVDGYERTLVFRNDGGFMFGGVSPDERWLVLGKVRNNADNDLFLFDTTSPGAAPKLITAHEGDVSHAAQDFTPEGKELLYTSNADGEFQRLWAYDLASGDRRLVEEADWDIMDSAFSRNGEHRVTGINADARTEIRVVATETGSPVALPKIPDGDITGVSFSRSGAMMAFYVNGSTSPSNLYVLDMASGEHRRLTSSLNPEIDERYLVGAEVIRYPSFDGLEIPAVLYRPGQASPTNPVPAVVWVHGGPGGQSRTGYNPMIQCLANHGYAVLAVNNRGSSGYGKTFHHMDDRRHGDVDLKDCIWARKHLESREWVDGSRIGIMGGSYGGYMVAAALAFEPTAFEVGIDIFGVTNWIRTLESIPPWWSDFREALYAEMGDPATDRERLHAISPLFHADRIERPLLVVQGANDPRVLQVESDEIVEAVRKNGVPVEYVVFEDEGHGFRSRDNRITAATAYLDFLDRYLRSR